MLSLRSAHQTWASPVRDSEDGGETADEVEDFAADAAGDGGVFEHGDAEGVGFEGGVEVAFDAAAHAFEDDQVGVFGGSVETVRNAGEVDEGLAGSGGNEGDLEA